MKQEFSSDFFYGLAIGILGGLAGNLLITSMYRWVDSKNIQTADGWTFGVGVLTLIVVLGLLYYGSKKKKR